MNLGQLSKQPLMWPPSELVDGIEPHDHVLPDGHRDDADASTAMTSVRCRGVPGVGAGWVYWEGAIPGTNPPTQLTLI